MISIIFVLVFASPNYDLLRKQMVNTQIIQRGIKDKRVIEAMLKVPRHEFVPKSYRPYAYKDTPLPIGHGQTISQPYIVALMTELLELKGNEKVLEIGTGSGYQAAVLSFLAKEVYTIEIIPQLAESAKTRLQRLGYTNVFVKCGDGFFGWKEHAPFDAIIITCAAPELPEPLVNQLKEGGKIVLPQGDNFQELIVYEKTPKGLKKKPIIPVRFVPMRGEIERRKK